MSTHRQRHAKIVATLGPASSSLEMIRALFDAGVDVFRLNFSHGTHEQHQERFELIRRVERERSWPIGVLADLQGPKLRVGTFVDGPVKLVPGAAFRLDLIDQPGDATRAYLPHREIFAALKPETNLLRSIAAPISQTRASSWAACCRSVKASMFRMSCCRYRP
jgi:pyruvate kinase